MNENNPQNKGGNSRRTFVRNLGLLTAAMTVSPPLLWRKNWSEQETRKVRIAAFGFGTDWPLFIQEIKNTIELECTYVQEFPLNSTTCAEEFDNHLKYLQKTEKLDGILLYYEQGDWEPIAKKVLQHSLHLYIKGPLPSDLRDSRKLALTVTSNRVIHWQSVFTHSLRTTVDSLQEKNPLREWLPLGTPPISTNAFPFASGRPNFYQDLSLWDGVMHLLPISPLSQVDGYVFNKRDTSHVLFHFGSGSEKQTWQWIKGEMAFHLLDEQQKLRSTENEAQVILGHGNSKEIGAINTENTKGRNRLKIVATHFSNLIHQENNSIKKWAEQILYHPSIRREWNCFSFYKLHQLTQILLLQKIVTDGFPYYRQIKPTMLRYPNDYLCLPWNPDSLAFTQHADLNTWIYNQANQNNC